MPVALTSRPWHKRAQLWDQAVALRVMTLGNAPCQVSVLLVDHDPGCRKDGCDGRNADMRDLGGFGHRTGPSDLLWPTWSSYQILRSARTLTGDQDAVSEWPYTPSPASPDAALEDPDNPSQVDSIKVSWYYLISVVDYHYHELNR